MNKNQMKSEIKRLELEVERITNIRNGAMESFKFATAKIEQAEACAEEWRRKYLDMLLLNISLAEKLANREDSGCSTT